MEDGSRILVFDGHNDTLLKLHPAVEGEGRSFFERADEGHIDLPRAREGALGGGMFAVFVPHEDDLKETDPESPEAEEEPEVRTFRTPELAYSQQTAMGMVAKLFRLEADSGGRLEVVRTASQLDTCLRTGVFAAVLHFEGAEAIDPGLDALAVYYEAGLRSLGIVWSRSNAFGHGVSFGFPSSPDTGPGLTDAGLDLVRACNQLGIVVDLSHLNEKGFWDVARVSDAPLVATHSAVYALCPSARNLTDPQLDAIGESGGLVGVNFHVGFLRADGEKEVETPIAEIVRHIDYIATRLGIEHVALGSDFDGATMPAELGDVTGLPRLLNALGSQGYTSSELRKLARGNWLRVLRQTWR
jgi:membrane dipeptidase